MFIRSLLLAGFFVTGIAHAAEVPSPLDQDVGKARPLVIVARTDADPTLVNLKKALDEPANRQAFNERNMVLYTIVGIVGKRDGKDLDPQSTMSLIRGLKPGMIIDDAKVILIGKDGEKKIEKVGAVTPAELFKTVDELPQQEKDIAPAVAEESKPVAPGNASKAVKPAKAVKALED